MSKDYNNNNYGGHYNRVWVSYIDLGIYAYAACLSAKDHWKVAKHLKKLDSEALMDLGMALGLLYDNLKHMTPLRDEMIAAWLDQQDNVVEQSGEPSWKSLKSALEDIEHMGIANAIMQGTGIHGLGNIIYYTQKLS